MMRTKLYRYRVPFTEAVSLGDQWHTHREGLLIRQSLPGVCDGWGEVAPLPGFSRETLPAVIDGLLGAAYLTGSAVPPSVTFGMDTAQAQWRMAATGDGALRRNTVRICALLTGPPDTVLARAAQAAATGYEAVKLKVGHRGLQSDLELARAVRQVIGPEVEFRLDANRAWGFPEAQAFATGIRDLGVAFVEEPMADPRLLPQAARLMPVALDESLTALSLGSLGNHAYAVAIVIKPALLGGIAAAVSWAEQAVHLGMMPVISAAYETGAGMLGLLYTAGQVSVEAAAGLDTYRLIQRDVLVSRLALAEPRVAIPALPLPDRDILTRIA